MDILLGIPEGDQTRSSFSQIKSFAQKFTNGLKLGSNDIRMGVFSYSSTAKPVVEISRGTSSSTVNNAIQGMRHGGGANRKDRAISYASRMFSRSSRSGVAKSVVLLTNGDSSSGSADLSTISESFPDMNIYPVAVGPDARTDAGLISNDYQYYRDFPDLVSTGPFEITTSVVEGATTGTGTVIGKLYITCI